MSDHDNAPDPIDEAYAQAEAMLSDEHARAARRARVLAAVESAPTAVEATPPRNGRPAWRSGGWLTAASITALCVGVFVSSQIYHPELGPTGPTARAHPPSAGLAAPNAAPLTPAAAAPATPPPARQGIATPVPPVSSEAPPAAVERPQSEQVPAADIAPAPPPPPAAPIIAPVPKAFPAAPEALAGNAPSDRTDSPRQYRVGAFSGGARDEVAAGSAEQQAPRRASVESVTEAPVAAKSESAPSAASDQAAHLRAAAAAGKTAEVEGLLAAGVPIDAADANGDTALIRSIQAGRSSVAAVLRRHGASLDHRNSAGQSARDIAKAKDDAELNQALGLAP